MLHSQHSLRLKLQPRLLQYLPPHCLLQGAVVRHSQGGREGGGGGGGEEDSNGGGREIQREREREKEMQVVREREHEWKRNMIIRVYC